MARSEHLAVRVPRRRTFVTHAQYKSAICLYFLPETSVKTRAIELSGENCHSVHKCILFEITRMQSVNRRIAALFYNSVMKVLKVRPVARRKKWVHRQISATRTTRYYDDFFIIGKTNLSLTWLVRLCMLPSDKIALKKLPGAIREL